MELIYIIGLVILGVGLLIVEILFIPGTTLFGIFGVITFCSGILVGYEVYGTPTGHYIFLGSTILAIGVVIYSLRSKSWKKLALESKNEGKFNEGMTHDLKEEMEGLAISNLRPMGKGEFEGKEYEVSTLGGFVDSGTKIKIIKVDHLKVFVEALNN